MTGPTNRSRADFERLRAQAGKLAREGWAQIDIARELKVSRTTLRNWARADGWRRVDLQGAPAPSPPSPSPELAAREARQAALLAADAGDFEAARKALGEAARLDRLVKDLSALRQASVRRTPEEMSDSELVAAVTALVGEN